MALAGPIGLIAYICIIYSVSCTAVKKWERNFELSSGRNAVEGHFQNREQKSVQSSKSRRIHTPTIESFATKEIIRFTEECLYAHNQYRKKHHVNPLELSEKLNTNSQKRADYLAKTNTFVHTPNNVYGENLYKFWSSEKIKNLIINGSEPARSWYETEIPYFIFGKKNSDYKKTGHFSQLLWANSKYLGVGVAKSSNTIYVVCQYDPPGNYDGQYDINVPPIGGFVRK